MNGSYLLRNFHLLCTFDKIIFRSIFIFPNIWLYFFYNIRFFTIDKASSRLGNNAETSKDLLLMGMVVDNVSDMVVAGNDKGPFANLASSLVVCHSHKIDPCSYQASSLVVCHNHRIAPYSYRASYPFVAFGDLAYGRMVMWTLKSLPFHLLYDLACHRTLAAVASYNAQPAAALASATTSDDRLADGNLNNVVRQAFVA